jgi:hypothetical protein
MFHVKLKNDVRSVLTERTSLVKGWDQWDPRLQPEVCGKVLERIAPASWRERPARRIRSEVDCQVRVGRGTPADRSRRPPTIIVSDLIPLDGLG